jgi:hypothetical protein
MKKVIIRGYIAGLLIGFVLGFVIFHPFSMVFTKIIHPVGKIYTDEILNAFNSHHLPMAYYFGLLGSLLGVLNVFYIKAISKQKKRVKILEELLPICAYCKRIRDDAVKEKGTGQWLMMEDYFSKKTDTNFTHGICPDCYMKVTEEDE